jgi:hypothetical protein
MMLAPTTLTEMALRCAEAMPGVTYKTRVTIRPFTETDRRALVDEGIQPQLYSLEAYDLDFTAFCNNLMIDDEGHLKRPGSGSYGDVSLADPFLFDAYKHGEPFGEISAIDVNPRAAAHITATEERGAEPLDTTPNPWRDQNLTEAENEVLSRFSGGERLVTADADAVPDVSAKLKETLSELLAAAAKLVQNLE